MTYRRFSRLKVSRNPSSMLWHKISCLNFHSHAEYGSFYVPPKISYPTTYLRSVAILTLFSRCFGVLGSELHCRHFKGKRCLLPSLNSAVIILHLHWRHSPEPCVLIFAFLNVYMEVIGGTVVWGTALQVGRSRVRFPIISSEFFIYIILPAPLWPSGRLKI
jgi:hypothetical protein